MVLDPIELERRLELAGIRQRSDMRRLARLALATGDPGWQQMLEATIRQKAAFVTPVHPFAPSPAELPEGDIQLGRLVHAAGESGPASGLEVDDLIGHVLIAGPTRSGKTSLLVHLVRSVLAKKDDVAVWVFTPTQGYVERLAAVVGLERLLGVPMGRLPRNPAEVLPGERPIDMAMRCTEVFREGMNWLDGASYLWLSAILALIDERGLERGGTEFPTIADIAERAESIRLPNSARLADYRTSLRRIDPVIRLMPPYSECQAAGDARIDRLIESRKCVVFDVASASPELLSLFVLDLVKAASAVLPIMPKPATRLLIVLDEAHRYFNRSNLAQREREGILLQLAAEGRHRGIGICFATQTVSQLPVEVAANVNVKIAYRLVDGASASWMGKAFGLGGSEATYLLQVPERHAVVHVPTIWPAPFVVRVPEVETPERQLPPGWMEAELTRMKWTRPERNERAVAGPAVNGKSPNAAPSVRTTGAPGGLSYEAISYLVKVGQTPLWPAGQRDESLRLSNYRGNRLRGELVGAQCIRLIEAPTGRPGNAVTLCELTEQGRALLEELGERPTHVRSRGGLLHKWVASRIAMWGENNGYLASVESTDARVDIVLERDGVRIAVEVCLTTAATEVVNIQKDQESGDFDSIWIVTVEESALRRVQRKLSEQEGDYSNVRLVLFTELVNSGNKEVRQSVASNGKRVGAGGRSGAGAGRDDGRGNAEGAEDAETARERREGEPASQEPTPGESTREGEESERGSREGKNDGRTGSNSEELVFSEVLAALAVIDDPMRLSARPLARVPEIEAYSRMWFAGRPAWRGRGLQRLLREAAALAIAELENDASSSLGVFMKAYVAGATVQDAAHEAGRSREHASRAFRPETARRVAMHIPTLLAASSERTRR